jgi:hypothetical protein
MEFLALIVSVIIASLAWLYQRAWERQVSKIERYQSILDKIPAFTVGNLDPTVMDDAYTEFRRLWLYAPDDVLKAANEFFLASSRPGDNSGNERLGKLIIKIRKDSSFSSAIIPKFFKTQMTPEEFLIVTSKKNTTSNSSK